MGRYTKVRKNLINEVGIYYPLSGKPQHYDIVVSMRIGDRQLQRKKKDVKNLGGARMVRDELVRELEKIKAETHRGDIFWEQALNQYLERQMALVKSKEMSFSTYTTRESMLKKHTKDWNSKKISEIHHEWIRIFFSEHFTDQSVETKKNVLKFIRQVFNHQIAIGNKTLYLNPTTGIKLRRDSSKRPATFSLEEMQRIIRHAHEVKSPWAAIYLMALQTGCRSGELFGLRWEDIDWKNKDLTVRRSYCWKLRDFKNTKNEHDRVIPLNESTIAYLQKLKAESKSEFILPHLSDWKKGRAAQILARVKKTLGISRQTNFHSIRSTFITELLMRGVPWLKVSRLAGHKDFKTTMIYVGWAGEELKGTTDVLGFEIMSSNVHPLKKEA